MTDLVTLTIDGESVSVPKGTLILDAATKLDKEIPIFCSHPKLDPVACCRMCLVEVEGPRGMMLTPACAVAVGQDMKVFTETPNVKAMQEANLAFILLNHPLDCPICDKGGECPLQDQTMRFGPGISQLVEAKRHKNKNYLISDTIVLDQERCVVCWRCIRYLEEWEDKPQLGLFERGGSTIIDIQNGQPVDAKTGGNIIDICPVGALTNRVARFNYRPWQIERTPSIDPHYSTGDNIRIDTRTHKIRRIIGRENMAVNDQWIADKTRFAYEWVNSEERLKQPLIRNEAGELVPTTWSNALQFAADLLTGVKQAHGADAIGGIGSTKVSNESNYLLQRFMRQLIGTNNIDHRNGGDVAALPTGLPALADIMKPQYGPNPKVDTIMLVGLDPSEELPILDLHLKRAVRRGKANLIIAHPRKVELTRYGGPYLAYDPGTLVTLLNALTSEANDALAEPNADVAQMLSDTTTEAAGKLCGVDVSELQRAAQMLATSQSALILYGPMAAQGEQGQQVVNALTNLTMVTGHYERLAYVGLDANSQGCRDMGVLPTSLPGHANLDDEAAHQRLSALWNCELPQTPGLTYKEMLDAAGSEMQALYIMGANPASERAEWAEKLAQLDILIVQDLFLTETAKLAHVVLPAVSWAETNGTFTSCERRVQRAPKALTDPHSKAAPDWMIIDHLATHMGVSWPYADERGILAEITKAAPIYEGLTWEALGDQGLQWDAGLVRSKPSYRKAEQPALSRSAENELALVAGTVSYDGGNMFRLTKQMHNIAFGPVVSLNPADAAHLGVGNDAAVTVRSNHGELALRVKLDAGIKVGTAWIPESLPGAPVGTLLNGSDVEYVKVRAR